MKNIINKEEMDVIQEFCTKHKIYKYVVNPDGSVDVNQDVHIGVTSEKEIPFKFNIINGDFEWNGYSLVSLKNAPHTVHGDFSVSYNMLKNLEGCPHKIDGGFSLDGNYNIRSLYVGEYDVEVGGVIKIDGDYLHPLLAYELESEESRELDDDEVADQFNGRTYDNPNINLILKYQRHYEIWKNKTELDFGNFSELIDDINDGLA